MDITVYLPDEIAALAKHNHINLSGVLRRGVAAELEALPALNDRLVVLEARWHERLGKLTDDEDAATERFTFLREARALYHEAPETAIDLRAAIRRLMAAAEESLVGSPST